MNSSSRREMSQMQANQWDSGQGVVAAAIALPQQGMGPAMREMMVVARDTMIVLMIQLAFRAMLLLRRWNY